MAIRRLLKWSLLVAATVGVTYPLTLLGVPSAALFAALVVGIALALLALAPSGIPRPAGIAAQGVLGVYIGTMVHQDAVDALGPHWPIVLAVAIATLLLSVVCGALLAMHRDVTPLTGSLALVAGGASGLVAIARELGGDDRVVVGGAIPAGRIGDGIDAGVGDVDLSRRQIAPGRRSNSNRHRPLVSEHRNAHRAGCGRRHRRPVDPAARRRAAGSARADGASRGHRPVVRTVGADGAGAGRLRADRLAGRAGVHPRIAARCRTHAADGRRPDRRAERRDRRLGVVLAHVAGLTPLEGYLATSPGGVYAVLATAVETGSNVTFIIAAQVVRILLMLFAAPLVARGWCG